MTEYNKRIGDSFGCGWREKFCGKVEQTVLLQGRRLRSCLYLFDVFRYVAFFGSYKKIFSKSRRKFECSEVEILVME